MSFDDFLAHAKPFYDKAGIREDSYALLDELLKPRITRFNEIEDKLAFVREYGDFDLSLFEHKKSKSTLDTSKAMLEPALAIIETADWNREALGAAMTKLAEDNGVKNSVVMWPVRVAAAGVAVTPGGCSEVLLLLGRDESVRRIKAALKRL